MFSSPSIFRGVSALAALGLAGALTGCAAGVKQETFSDEIEQLREEMRSGDEQLSRRIDEMSSRTDRLESQLQSLQEEFDVTVERLQGMLRFNVPVHFAFDDASIREADKPILDRFAKVAKDFYPDAVITVEGFADPAGPMGYNLSLGQRRAESVATYLVKNGGLDRERIKTVSYGEASKRQVVPGAQGPGEAGLENRRVALVIDYAGGPAEARVTVTDGS